jgi:hypothetical protein
MSPDIVDRRELVARNHTYPPIPADLSRRLRALVPAGFTPLNG